MFLRTWGFEHRTISPHFHQSNELVERAIQTVKGTIKKTKLANEGHFLSILFLNSQPDENWLSPAHKLFNHPISTNQLSIKLQPKPSITKTPELSIIEKTWDKKRSVIAPDNHSCSFNVLKLTKSYNVVKLLCKQKLTYLQILLHHQLEQNLDALLENQRDIWRNVE